MSAGKSRKQRRKPVSKPVTWSIELMVEEQDTGIYHVRWDDGCWHHKEILLANIPEPWLDLLPYMAARRLLDGEYSLDRLLIVRLQGADLELMRAPLGVVAATPLLNTNKPVTQPAHYLYRKNWKGIM
jgi:hypothetical protein